MRRPRFSILGLMALVTLAALDCGALDLIAKLENALPGWREVAFLVLLGETAMANALAIAAWLAWRRRGPRSIAFLAVGTPLMLVFVSATAAVPDAFLASVQQFETRVLEPLERAFPSFFDFGLVGDLADYLLALAVLSLPQLVPSLLAAAFFGRYRVRIERRREGAEAVE